MTMSVEELRELSNKVARDPDTIYSLSLDQAVALRKHLNPLGNVVSAKKTYVNMGIVNWRERYLRKLHTTALIGYLFRTLEEYEPEGELAKEKARYKDGPQTPEALADHQARTSLIKSTAKGIIHQFLSRNFDFDPDKHLRGSHSENSKDPERKPKDALIRETCKLAESAPQIDVKLASRPEQTYKYLRSNMLSAYNATAEAATTLKSILSVLGDPIITPDDKQGILLKKYKQLTDITTDMRKIAGPLSAADTLSACVIDPPVDVFHQFDRYLTNHYEQLRAVVQALYNDKGDFEFGVVMYESHKTSEEAATYRRQHEREFRTEVLAIESGEITLLGPFKENRDRVDFYNKNTEVAKRMLEQLEMDHKLGKDFMEKKRTQEVKKNIEEAGPAAPRLEAYKKAMGVAQSLSGADHLTKEDRDKLEEAVRTAQQIKEDYEVPDDSIQIDMFYPEHNPTTGQTELRKTKFYTQAEAPLHLQEDSPYIDKYQPVRQPTDGPVDTAYRTKTIKGKNGRKMEVKVPIKK